jgi:hypothetical protein
VRGLRIPHHFEDRRRSEDVVEKRLEEKGYDGMM